MSDTQHDPLAAPRVERLDVEDDDRRQQRFRTSSDRLQSVYANRQEYADDIFMQLDSKPTPTPDAPRTFDFGDRTTFPVAPPTERTL